MRDGENRKFKSTVFTFRGHYLFLRLLSSIHPSSLRPHPLIDARSDSLL